MKTNLFRNTLSILFLLLVGLQFSSCEKDEDPEIQTKVVQQIIYDTAVRYAVSIRMVPKANDMAITLNTSNQPYVNNLGQHFMVSKLRYLISDVCFHKADGSSFTINEYHLTDMADTTTFTFNPTAKVPAGNYSSISFKFGFDREDNQSGAYADLNSATWNWPSMLGGGYHFMQFEGMYDSLGKSKPFATHMGTARNISGSVTTFEDNHFVAKPVNSAITIDGEESFKIIMNAEQWYEAPYDWDFNVFGLGIMPNYDAQRKLNLNGPSVFTVEI